MSQETTAPSPNERERRLGQNGIVQPLLTGK